MLRDPIVSATVREVFMLKFLQPLGANRISLNTVDVQYYHCFNTLVLLNVHICLVIYLYLILFTFLGYCYELERFLYIKKRFISVPYQPCS